MRRTAALACLFIISIAAFTYAADASATADVLAEAIEKARADHQIPGIAVAVIKDDQVVLCRGFGLRDVENNLPVTPDTLFAIGSCTKAFTAMGAAIAQDEGKLTLDDSPKKYLPDFKLQDPEADEKITLRDMLCHRSGLTGTDISWYTGVLSRDQVIQVACLARPTVPFRSKFQYQNTMYSAAGEAAARACGTTWEQLVADRILRPLGMINSNFSVKQMQQSKDFARGYSYDVQTKESRLVPVRDLTNIAPAGAINSCANDMAKWVRLMLNRGQINGTRIVSEDRFNELVTAQSEVGPNTSYALGWLVHKWHDVETWEHAGGIDGFNAYVVIVPEKKLGYALLTNVSSSPLNGTVREIIWKQLVDPAADPDPSATLAGATQPSVDPRQEVGTYGILEIVYRDDSLYAIVAGQPDYKLENVGGRRYKLSNAPPGFFVTFRDNRESGAEVFLEQPHGNVTFPREPSADEVAQAIASYAGPHKDLLGTYSMEGFSMEITLRGGKVVAIVKGQPTYTLVEKAKDVFSMPPAPPSFELRFRRDPRGAVTGVFVKQPRPQPDMELKRTSPAGKQIDVDTLIQRAIDAIGGEANLRKHSTLSMTYDIEMENQGVNAHGTATLRAPNAFTRTTEFIALGKSIGSLTESFDGTTGHTEGSFLQKTPYTKTEIAEAKVVADFFGPAGWKSQFQTISSKGTTKVADEDCSVLEMKPQTGPTVTVYISDTSGLVLRRDYSKSSARETELISEFFSDYRDVGGVKVPHKIEQKSAGMGRVVTTVKSAHFAS